MNTEHNNQIDDKALQSIFPVWQHMKVKYPAVIVLVSSGERYFAFGSDAATVCTLIEIKTIENSTYPNYCSVPRYLADKLLQKMVKAGRSIAFCDPLSASKK